jgi:dihydropteroate synthase
MNLRARNFRFAFPGPALLMGVVNVTPDSFSDAGQTFQTSAAVDLALKLIDEGADIIDIGGESTRPGALPVPEHEELRRVIPVIEILAGRTEKPLSVDTMKAGVAEKALAAGASIVNDVAANRSDPEMWRIVAESGAGYVLMHMQGTPQTMQREPKYDNVIATLQSFFEERLSAIARAGVNVEQTILDVGIGFGKTAQHNLQLLRAMRDFTKWGRPLMVGVSRKGFIGQLSGAKEVAARLPGSLACACWAIAAGVQIIRTHDVAATRAAIRMTEAILGSDS